MYTPVFKKKLVKNNENKEDEIKKSTGVKKKKNSSISQCKKVQKAPKVYIALFPSTGNLFVK